MAFFPVWILGYLRPILLHREWGEVSFTCILIFIPRIEWLTSLYASDGFSVRDRGEIREWESPSCTDYAGSFIAAQIIITEPSEFPLIQIIQVFSPANESSQHSTAQHSSVADAAIDTLPVLLFLLLCLASKSSAVDQSREELSASCCWGLSLPDYAPQFFLPQAAEPFLDHSAACEPFLLIPSTAWI